MQFIQQYVKGRRQPTIYFLTVMLTLTGILIGNFILAGVIIAKTQTGKVSNINEALDQLGTNLQLFLLLLPFAIALLILLICIKFIHNRPIRSVFTSRQKFDWKRYFLSFGIWSAFLVIFLILSALFGAPIEWNFDASSFFILLLVGLIMLPIQTAMEDVFFRGYLFQAFGSVFKHAGWSILVTGAMFGLLHGANPEVAKIGYGLLFYYIFSGLFLGVLAHMDDGLELGMGYHAANNVFAGIILTNDWQAFQTDALFIDHSPPAFDWASILTLVIIQPLLLLIFAKIYKWKNWKERLFGKFEEEV